MAKLERDMSGAVERIGALLEMHLAKAKGWELGAVEREAGSIEAYVLVGFGRSPAHIRFDLSTATNGLTRVQAGVKAKSRFSSERGCLALAHVVLDAIAAKSSS